MEKSQGGEQLVLIVLAWVAARLQFKCLTSTNWELLREACHTDLIAERVSMKRDANFKQRLALLLEVVSESESGYWPNVACRESGSVEKSAD